uniref:Uncharacterized protein n=1 Tax=Candidatus Kentrum eta TaxID=2126337 RepID=A0A450V749_9GAMM|nr:MAG: hypothetical protein BECKH772A_GA0070896_100302 [Candidatus Kentron sp. H]VFJ99204.1 MAG: hypothetical protein BECKH772C_GA0070978_1002930 [Candidatus Kentron sp. H]VFK00586.1 MAG: hypothetical protein BECKH772B_GA0070898_101958 [Candidatus Kentron sp. H]
MPVRKPVAPGFSEFDFHGAVVLGNSAKIMVIRHGYPVPDTPNLVDFVIIHRRHPR